ncbi:MAG: RsmB/NOP family class I SAM-dependent RNA methyltransferase [candidate division WOR-3 bacterium]|nr:RsmB/NOP family class I SAM-dependent RNA methyltransferase [candidate division WOR-3 bacterium]MCX7837114.1 RsmB/NOP family class I SAM-dependent RNA methyltransferase [candidate division WOR-3 bacterium]MDW8113988.1 RsmB/NOP family class I SAM-dependent RNA methyltransferase [candidate division WOR-3 bacterium]
MKLPEKFILRYEKIIPEFTLFLKSLEKKRKLSIRINSLKVNKRMMEEILKKYDYESITFYPYAFRLKSERDEFSIGNTLEHFLGYIYVQDIASMIPPIVLEPKKYEKVLDLTAAPGSKTTLISAIMENTGLIVANDINIDRLKALTGNIDRMGCLNVVITNLHGERFGNLFPEYFDKVLLDAPCSSEGTISKNYEVLNHWNELYINKMAKIQKNLIISAFKSLKKDGILVYSTCTFAPEENEGVIDFLLRRYDNALLEEINIPGIKTCEGITEWEGFKNEELKRCVRIYPHYNECEGFFIARIRKLP